MEQLNCEDFFYLLICRDTYAALLSKSDEENVKMKILCMHEGWVICKILKQTTEVKPRIDM